MKDLEWLVVLTSVAGGSFEKDTPGQAPSGFKFPKTAKARAGKWEVKADPVTYFDDLSAEELK